MMLLREMAVAKKSNAFLRVSDDLKCDLILDRKCWGAYVRICRTIFGRVPTE